MRRVPISVHLPLSTSLMALVLFLGQPTDLAGQFCGSNEPGMPVPECRNRFTGDEVSCGNADAVRIWPDGLRPGEPDRRLPLERDSTQWLSHTVPGFSSGHELYHSLDAVGDLLVVAYNAGLQVWDISGEKAEDPERLRFRDGWSSQFLQFPSAGENDFFVDDVDAIDPAGGNQDLLIVLSGKDGVGTSLWEYKVIGEDLDQLYQDPGTDSRTVQIVQFGGGIWAFAGGPSGVFVYDVRAAQSLESPCLDNAGSSCGGVYRGRLGTMTTGGFVSVIERGGRLYVAASDGSPLPSKPLGVEIWEVTNPASPSNAVLRFSGLSSATRGTTLFEHGGRYYLAVVERNGAATSLNIYNVTSCLDNNGCASVGAPVWSVARGSNAVDSHLTFSTSNGVPFLYYGLETHSLAGTRAEGLFDLSTLGSTNQIREITDGGGRYTDSCTDNTVDYWGDYYADNGHGLRSLAPRVGKFNGDYFYRAAFGILDVHVRTEQTPALAAAGPSDCFVGDAELFQATATSCTPSATYDWDAGDGVVSGSGSSVQITWPTPGTKTVNVTNSGCPGAVGVTTIECVDPAPQLSALVLTPSAPRICETPTFSWTATGKPPIDFDFEIRDSGDQVVHSGSGTDIELFDWPTDDTTPAGGYTAVLTASNSTGSDTVTVPFTLGAASLAFTSPPTFDGAPLPRGLGNVAFSVGTAGASEWIWDYGDGSPPQSFASRAAGESPTHPYTQPSPPDDPYIVNVTIKNCVGATEMAEVPIEIIEIPIGINSFRANCLFGICTFCTGEEVNFTLSFEGEPDFFQYDWDGDGTFDQFSSTPVDAHTFDAAGSQIQPVVKIGASGQEVTAASDNTLTVSTCAPPPPPPPPQVPRISVSGPTSRQVGQAGTYNATATNCTPSPSGWTWTASGGTVSGGGSQVSIFWSAAGTKTVTARNSACSPASGSRSVLVTQSGGGGDEGELDAAFTFSPANPGTEDLISFNATSSTGDIVSYEWNFGDGTAGSGVLATHTYANPGTYQVRLTIGEGGCASPACFDAETRNVVVTGQGGPAINVTAPATTLPINAAGTFTATARNCTASANGWIWTTDGGQIFGAANGSQVAISWASPGQKSVTASNSGCGLASGAATLTVFAAPLSAQFSFSPASPVNGQAVRFDGSLSTGNIATYDWSFGDGTIATDVQATHVFATPGNFRVTLTVGEAGCASPACFVSQTQIVNVTAASTPPAAPSNLKAIVLSSTRIALTWEDNSNDEQRFFIEQRLDGGGFEEIDSPSADTTERVVTKLEPATAYTFRVGARNAAGSSAYSNEVRVVTDCRSDILCVDDRPGDKRFEITLRFSTEQGEGQEGDAQATSLSGLGITKGGILSFNNRSNPEVLVKTLNGCGINGHYWVLFAATTNLGFEMTVRDTLAGVEKVYVNPDGVAAAAEIDLQAFATCDLGEAGLAASMDYRATGGSALDLRNLASKGTCAEDGTTLCVDNQPGDQRFRIRAHFQTEMGEGMEGDAQAIPLAPLGISRGGILTFVDPTNPEVLIKVLDGCAINGHFWVFFAATTNMGFDITVEDTETGAQKIYSDPDQAIAVTVTDIEAFATCDP